MKPEVVSLFLRVVHRESKQLDIQAIYQCIVMNAYCALTLFYLAFWLGNAGSTSQFLLKLLRLRYTILGYKHIILKKCQLLFTIKEIALYQLLYFGLNTST